MGEKSLDALLLGIGNVLWADEGFGVRCIEHLLTRWMLPERVQAMDGGTQGLYMLPYVQQAERLLVFDAVDFGDAPGALRVVVGDEVPRFLGANKMSLHQAGFQEVLFAAEMTNSYPREVVLIGVQPAELEDYGGSLTPAVKMQVPRAVELGVTWLERWGLTPQPRTDGEIPLPFDAALALEAYEVGRPSPEAACRFGDERFLALALRR
ncbi:HyaD/HybD family hydrogenase maturation endopeptidase [Hydrogenophilus islandicus]